MKHAALLLCCVLAACAAPATPPAPSLARSVAITNGDFERPPVAGGRCPAGWACKSHADPGSHRFFLDEAAPAAGARSLCIERVTGEPWALATFASLDPVLRGTRARFSLQVRVDGATGGGGGPWVLVHGPAGNLHHDQRLISGQRGWERMSIEFPVAANAQIVEVGATLEGGGRVCIDDARLEILSPPKNAV